MKEKKICGKKSTAHAISQVSQVLLMYITPFATVFVDMTAGEPPNGSPAYSISGGKTAVSLIPPLHSVVTARMLKP